MLAQLEKHALMSQNVFQCVLIFTCVKKDITAKPYASQSSIHRANKYVFTVYNYRLVHSFVIEFTLKDQ